MNGFVQGLLAMALLAGALPAAHAAGGNVQMAEVRCPRGKHIGGGTATLNTAAGTLVLENVILGGAFHPVGFGLHSHRLGDEFICPWQRYNRPPGADTPALAIRLQQGSSLTLSARGSANAVYCPAGSLTAEGPGQPDGVLSGISCPVGTERCCLGGWIKSRVKL